MTFQMLKVTHGHGRLSFATRDDNQPLWWRELNLDGRPLYRIGNTCDTCEAIFGRLSAAQMPLAPVELANRLRAGLLDLSKDMLDTVAAILPDGHYAAALLSISPAYFPAAHRLRSGPGHQAIRQKTMLSQTIALPEVFLPLIGEDQYDPGVIEAYEQAIANNSFPTALALSVLDVRFPSGKAFEWQLAHFLLDGHHKIMAACRVGRPITLLSFYAMDESFAPQSEVDQVLKLRYKS